jgi:hypothetical protein
VVKNGGVATTGLGRKGAAGTRKASTTRAVATARNRRNRPPPHHRPSTATASSSPANMAVKRANRAGTMFHSNGSDSIAVQGSRTGVGCPPTRSLDPSESTMLTTSMVAPTPTTHSP